MNRVALVTGGASGIGRALVHRLSQEGAQVVVVDVDEVGARGVAGEVGGATAISADVGDPVGWERVVAKLDRLDIACLNAGVITGTGEIAELTDEQYRRILGVNVGGVVLGLRALLPLLEESGGQVVATASLAGLIPVESDPIYSGTKHFVVGFVRSIAPQLERRGVRINAVCPGIVDTPILGEEGRTRLVEAGFPLLRPEEIAEAFLVAISSGETGQAWACQPGRPPERYRFQGVPGPRVPGAEGVRPPI